MLGNLFKDYHIMDYQKGLELFLSELSDNAGIKSIAEYYSKSIDECVKALKCRISVNYYDNKTVKKVYIDFTDTVSGLAVKQTLTF